MEPPPRRPGDPPPRQPSDPGQPGARPPGQQDPTQRTSVLRSPTISVEPAQVRAEPDRATELVLAVTNRSDTVNEFRVVLDDPSVGWIRIEPPTKNIWPGARDVFRIIVQPPRSSDVRAGLKEYGLRILSEGIPGGQATASMRIEVLPFEAVEARLVPRTSSGYTKGLHRVELRNTGSAPWTAAMTAVDPEDVLRFKVPRQVMVMPAEALSVPVAVRAKRWAWFGSSSKHEFSISLTREGGAPIRTDGVFDQQPFVPKKLIPPILAVAAASVAIALFATGVLPPKPPPTPPPSPTPTVGPTATATAPPTATATASPTEVPSETPPANVEQWALDARNALRDRTPSFDVGDFIGQTGTSANTAFQFQRYTNALLYRPVSGTDFFVIRDPILGKFTSVVTNVADPITGLPRSNRRNDKNERYAQPFAVQSIACSPLGCFVVPNTLFSPWFDNQAFTQVGYPIADVAPRSDGQAGSFLQLEQGYVVELTGVGVAVCRGFNDALVGDPGLCVF